MISNMKVIHIVRKKKEMSRQFQFNTKSASNLPSTGILARPVCVDMLWLLNTGLVFIHINVRILHSKKFAFFFPKRMYTIPA